MSMTEAKYQETVGEDDFIRNIIPGYVFDIFDKFWINKYRQICIGILFKSYVEGLTRWHADWVENRIPLYAEGNDDDQKIAKQLLQWYMVATTNHNLSIRALLFTLKVKDETKLLSDNDVSKLIWGKLKRNPDLYDQKSLIVPLCDFFNHVLNVFATLIAENITYDDNQWFPFFRVLQCIKAIKNSAFHSPIKTIFAAFEKSSISPDSKSDLFTKEMHLAFIRQVLDVLGQGLTKI